MVFTNAGQGSALMHFSMHRHGKMLCNTRKPFIKAKCIKTSSFFNVQCEVFRNQFHFIARVNHREEVNRKACFSANCFESPSPTFRLFSIGWVVIWPITFTHPVGSISIFLSTSAQMFTRKLALISCIVLTRILNTIATRARKNAENILWGGCELYSQVV